MEFIKRLKMSPLRKQQKVIARLLKREEITAEEAVLLMQEVNIQVYVAQAEMSSGAKIVGGSNCETPY